MTPNARRQATWRERRAARMGRMQAALETIVARLKGSEDPIDQEIEKIALDGLAGVM